MSDERVWIPSRYGMPRDRVLHEIKYKWQDKILVAEAWGIVNQGVWITPESKKIDNKLVIAWSRES